MLRARDYWCADSCAVSVFIHTSANSVTLCFVFFTVYFFTVHWTGKQATQLRKIKCLSCSLLPNVSQLIGWTLSLVWQDVRFCSLLALWLQLPAIFSSVSLSLPLCFSQVRKFVAKDSAGLRVRSHPSLQSEQIGIVQVNGTITFIDEVNRSRIGPNCSELKSFSVFSFFYLWT